MELKDLDICVCLPMLQEPDRKREQFMAVLAQRYPQYADRISGSQYSGSGSESGYPIQVRGHFTFLAPSDVTNIGNQNVLQVQSSCH